MAARAARVGSVSVDEALGEALGVGDRRSRDRLIAGLEAVRARLGEEGS